LGAHGGKSQIVFQRADAALKAPLVHGCVRFVVIEKLCGG
jgi:hypothetical protein